jgi:DNA-binding CsgD family transcriptional regulator
MRIETVHQMTSMYNYQRYQQIVSMKERSERRMIRIVIFSVLTLIAIFMLIINRYRKNRRERQAKVLRLFQKYNDTIRKYNKATEELDKLKSKDNSLLSDKEQEIHELTQQLASYRDILSSIRSRDQLSRFKKSDVISLFKEMSVGKRDCRLPDEEDWNRLAEQFSIFLPTTSNVIGSPQLLSPQELRTCILLAAGFTNGEIGVLLNASPQLISNIKTRVNRKLFGEETAATLMDNLVHLLGNV